MSSFAAEFDRELNSLFDARTHDLRSQIWAKRGAAPKFTKTKIKKSIERLNEIAETALLRMPDIRDQLSEYDHKKRWHPKRGKGFGWSAKKREFRKWYDEHITTRNCVYVFWRNKRCLYVGRTLNGKGRPSAHFEKHWFSQATRIDVYGFDRKREVPRFECLFTHRHRPTQSRIRPATKRYYTRCPICVVKENIRYEIKYLFRLK